MNFWKLRSLGKLSLLRRLFKSFFSAIYYKGRIIVIQRGPLRSLKWVCDPIHQFWMPLGIYEAETSSWLQSRLKEGMTFVDIGANSGYFSLLGSIAVGSTGTVVSCEPVPLNCSTIQSHLNANQIGNVILLPYAISDLDGPIHFNIDSNNANSHISTIKLDHASSNVQEVIETTAVRLDTYFSSSNLVPNLIKVDVEGAEAQVLRGAMETLRTHRPLCIVSTHSNTCYDDCYKILVSCGYKVENLPNFEHEIIASPI